MGNTPAMPQSDVPLSEVDVETSGISTYLSELGFRVRSRKSGIIQLDKSWPTKNVGGSGSGEPDLLLFTSQRDDAYPVCVWENKATSTGVDVALEEAQGYVEGAHAKLAGRPNLPRIAVGYDGVNLKATYLAPDNRWVVLREDGEPVLDYFPDNERVSRGVRADGNLVEAPDRLDARVLRNVFDQLRTLYRGIPALKSGRRPIDFTVALLTLRLVIEREQWGSWSEQPTLVPDAKTLDQQVAERFRQLAARCMGDSELSDSYGSIFKFTEHDENDAEVAFDFEAVLKTIPTGKNFFARMYVLLDALPLLHGADIDIFGEVYQAIGDDAVKRAFGEYFTGRHIIAGLVPVFLRRSGVGSFEGSLNGKTIADVACGTGGFLTETLRFVRREYNLPEADASDFAADSFFGYDLSSSNASRARVNMYFAGDGFSVIQGGVDSLDAKATKGPRKKKFDYILTNPPYGKSSEHHLLHEAFLERVIDLLKPGTGWGLVVMPTGTFENPRSSKARLNLLRTSRVTDVISLPKHAFAPYTTQRTAVVIFQKRAQPISGTTWEEVVSKVGNEKVAFFVVDHDGYANSDKRFPTRRRGLDGRWVHDDFAPWIDGEGARHPGSLFQALIDEVEPPSSTQGRKYARLSINDLVAASRGRGADRGAGVELLPDNYLRHEVESVPVAEFLERAERINAAMKGEIELAGVSIMSEIKSLTASPLDFGAGNAVVQKLEQLCTVNKGNPGLTEAAIYDAFDAGGLPVYGGGVGLPTQHVTPSARTSFGKAVTVFEGPAIVLSVDGSSGAMQVIPEGKFVCNHHAAVLTAKSSDANLNLIAQQAEARLKGLASNKTGSATLTLGTIKSLSIELPLDDDLGAQVGAARAELSRLRRLLS